ncbi:CaiB/BaiF CoA transferase family protein, partial [Gordonibacter sp.]
MKSKILDGVKVLDFGTYVAGAAISMVLAKMGAEVIKIEHPTKVDGGRYFLAVPGASAPDARIGAEIFSAANIGKKSLSVDVQQDEGREIVFDLIKQADILIENMSPGSMVKRGLGYEAVRAVNPGIVYLSSSSCGQTGPESFFVGYAPTFAQKSGLGHLTGYPGTPPSNFITSIDMRSATMSIGAVLAALFHRRATGKGQYIDLASQEAIAFNLGDCYLDYIVNGDEQGCSGNRREGFAPQDAYPTSGSDEWVAVSVSNDEEWAGLCRAMDRSELVDDPRFATYRQRVENADALDSLISAWTQGRDNYAAAEALQRYGVPSAPCLNSEGCFNDGYYRERGVFVELEHRQTGRDFNLSCPWRFSEAETGVTTSAPLLG